MLWRRNNPEVDINFCALFRGNEPRNPGPCGPQQCVNSVRFRAPRKPLWGYDRHGHSNSAAVVASLPAIHRRLNLTRTSWADSPIQNRHRLQAKKQFQRATCTCRLFFYFSDQEGVCELLAAPSPTRQNYATAIGGENVPQRGNLCQPRASSAAKSRERSPGFTYTNKIKSPNGAISVPTLIPPRWGFRQICDSHRTYAWPGLA